MKIRLYFDLRLHFGQMRSIARTCPEADIIALTGNFLNAPSDFSNEFRFSEQILCMGEYLQSLADIVNGPTIICTSGREDIEYFSLLKDFNLDKIEASSGISYDHSSNYGWIRHFLSGHAFKAPIVCDPRVKLLRLGRDSAVFYSPQWTPVERRDIAYFQEIHRALLSGRKLANENGCQFIVLTNEPPYACSSTNEILRSLNDSGPDYWLCGDISDLSYRPSPVFDNPFVGLPYYTEARTLVLCAGASLTQEASYVDVEIGERSFVHFDGSQFSRYHSNGALDFGGSLENRKNA